jgi:hypothetical protein
MIVAEVHAFPVFRFVAFLLTIWGKGLMFLFLGFFEFRNRGVGLAAAIVFWALFAACVVLFFVIGTTAAPLTQKESPPEFATTDADYSPDAPADNANASATAPLDDGAADAPPPVYGPAVEAPTA